jgi:hypothetical protein
MRIHGSGAKRELVEVGFPDNDAAGVLKSPDRSRGLLRPMPSPNSSPGRRGNPFLIKEVLHGDGNTMQRPADTICPGLPLAHIRQFKRGLSLNRDERVQ